MSYKNLVNYAKKKNIFLKTMGLTEDIYNKLKDEQLCFDTRCRESIDEDVAVYDYIATDTHLSNLYRNVRIYYRNTFTSRINKPVAVIDNHINYHEDVLSKELSERLRKFINDIPLPENLQPLSFSNFPTANVLKETCLQKNIKDAIENPIYDPKEWTYELYKNYTYRLKPKSLRSFVGSPIFEALSVFDTLHEGYEFHTVVLNVAKDGCGKHTNKFSTREYECVYHLTSNDWSNGELVIYTENNVKLQFLPKFNTMVEWNMKEQDYQHSMNKSNSEKKRIELFMIFHKK